MGPSVSQFSGINFLEIVFLAIILPTILFSVTLAIELVVMLFLFILISVHLGIGLFHIPEQQLCILSHQGFNIGFQRCYPILVSTSRGRKL
jgi:hypothetical protein